LVLRGTKRGEVGTARALRPYVAWPGRDFCHGASLNIMCHTKKTALTRELFASGPSLKKPTKPRNDCTTRSEKKKKEKGPTWLKRRKNRKERGKKRGEDGEDEKGQRRLSRQGKWPLPKTEGLEKKGVLKMRPTI